MRTSVFRNLSILLLGFAFALSGYFAQTPQTLPSASPEASPSVSPSPTPTRAPSPTPLPGAQNFHQWGSVTVFNGLPSDSVRAITQTPDGVMWFGTDNGLARFDGRRVQKLVPDGSGADRILALKTAPSGEIWVGTQAGAFVYVDDRFTPVKGTEGKGITAMLIGSQIYLGTDTGTVVRAVSETNGERSTETLTSGPIVDAAGAPLVITGIVEADGNLIASTSGRGLFAIRSGRASEIAGQRAPLFVNALSVSTSGEMAIGADAPTASSGLYEERESSFARITLPTARVLSLENNESGLWVGTERFGLFHVVDSKLKKSYSFENTSGGLRSNTVYTFFTDREGVLWIGTNRGVSRFDRSGASQETLSDSANENFIRTLFRSSEGIVYAGSNRGLFKRVEDKWLPDPSQGNRPIFALGEDQSGRLMVGSTERGSIESATWDFTDFKREKYAAVNGLGLVQISSGANVVRFAERSISSLAADGDKLYIGTTDKGLFVFDGRSTKPEIVSEALSSGTIWKIKTAADGALWVAGQHGVFRIRDQRAEKIIDAEEVRDVFVDGEYIWAATTTRGLLQARFDERFGLLISEVGFEQGLPSEKAFAILPEGDGILVATNRGVVTYRRGQIAPKIIPTRIASQRSHDLKEAASTIALDYPQNSLLIEVAGQSSRTFPEEFQYAFVLINAKGEEVSRQLSGEFQYAPPGLSAGEYMVEAIAFNRDLLASEPLRIRFSIANAPFPWTATALGVLLLIALLGLVWAFIANRRVLVRNRELAIAKLDLANEAERERRRIARDLHDQTLADLRSLMLLSDNARPEIPGFRDEIEAISGEVRRICEDLSPSVLENVGLVAALEFLLKGAIEYHHFTAKEDLEEEIGFSMNIQLQIYRIAQEVLTNIKSHSSADLVEMNVDKTSEEFVLEITDNGAAFAPDSVTSRGRGIANIRARASMIGAEIDWQPVENGNRFSLTVPK